MSDPARLLPIVYDPPIGEACLKFGHICRQTAGLYLSITRRKVTEILRSWPLKDIRFICILTAAESSALGGPWRKRHGHPHWQAAILYGGSRCAPQYLLPMYLDAGTNNERYLHDPSYRGLRRTCPPTAELFSFVDEFVNAEVFPKCCNRWSLSGFGERWFGKGKNVPEADITL